MIAGIALGVLAVVAAIAVWRRALGSQAERHSIHSYEHALDVLGDVSKRSDSSASVRVVPPDEASRSHIRAAEGEEGHGPGVLPPPAHHEPRLRPRITLQPPTAPGVAEVARRPGQRSTSRPFPRPARKSAERSAQRPLQPPAQPAQGLAEGPADRERTAGERRRTGAGTGPKQAGRGREGDRAYSERTERLNRQVRARRVTTAGLAAVAIAAATFAAFQLAGGSKHKSAAPPTTTHPTTTTTPPTSTTSVPTTTAAPKVIPPQSVSATDVSYIAPAHRYTFAFSAVGPCWIGIEQQVGGPYLWDETLTAGETASFSATGTTVVRLGAPSMARISVDGLPVQLASNSQPYDLLFAPPS